MPRKRQQSAAAELRPPLKSVKGSLCAEHSLGSAKLLFVFVLLSANEFEICMSAKDYALGIFCLDSALVQKEFDIHL